MTNEEREIALKMAIEGLDEEPCDDFISRKFMLKLGATCIAKKDGSGNLIAIRAIKELQPATIIRSKGRWIKDIRDKRECFGCSECSYHVRIRYH